MKMLQVLSILQSIAIIVLIVAFFTMSNKLNTFQSKSSQAVISLQSDQVNNPSTYQSSPLSNYSSNIDAEGMRIIVREEVEALLYTYSLENTNLVDKNKYVAEHDPIILKERFNEVDEKIKYYISLGKITEQEMGDLQTNIAKLDSKSRTEMLKQLTSAMNNGLIEGHF